MENNQSPSKKKLISIQEEKLVRDYCDSKAGNSSRAPKKELLLDLEILQKNSTRRQPSQRVLVSIKPRTPAIKTIYIAEKSRFYPKKVSEKLSRSRLGIGDHSSFTTQLSGEDTFLVKCNVRGPQNQQAKRGTDNKDSSSEIENSTNISDCSETAINPDTVNDYSDKNLSTEQCYILTPPPPNMNLSQIEFKAEQPKTAPNKVDIATLVQHDYTSVASEDSVHFTAAVFYKLNQRIDHLERQIEKQAMVIRSIDPDLQRSSDEDCDDSNMRSVSGTGRPGCSYIQNYSQIPESSAFQRYAQQSQISPPSQSRATTLEKEHNSEQYGRDFTAYDGITARGRRQCASVPCKRDDFPKGAAERVHKIRHKLNPVRDYRLMDTVHYLAQGEFAPRDDGIKLTPSREAVLSDIIYEDVCRTHWPTTRLGRRAQAERCSTRCELQRLIDSLLRERVQHVERRRRRHYRIVKLNHRHESCRPVGKTGDIIVASHKNRDLKVERESHISDHNAASAMLASRHWDERRGHRSHDRLTYPEKTKRQSRQEEGSPGTSSAVHRGPGSREPTCCYRTAHSTRMQRKGFTPIKQQTTRTSTQETSSSTMSKPHQPRLVVKKDASGSIRMKHSFEEPNLEQYIVLPTLVIRTPSNVKRQKKFNELYHRILNVQLNYENVPVKDCTVAPAISTPSRPIPQSPLKKDIGLNVNITLSGSNENITKKLKTNNDEHYKKYDDGNKRQKSK